MKVPDLFLINAVERVANRLQWLTHIPKYKFTLSLYCSWVLIQLWCMLSLAKVSILAAVGISLWMIVSWNLLSRAWQFLQEESDRNQMPILSGHKSSFWLFLIRMVIIALYITAGMDNFIMAAGSCLFILGMYVNAGDIWPNNGPRLRDRWKSFVSSFSVPKLQPVRTQR